MFDRLDPEATTDLSDGIIIGVQRLVKIDK